MKNNLTKLALVLASGFLTTTSVFAIDQGSLTVQSITPTQTLATPDGNFDNGWQWIFNVTVPTNEKVVRVKFANWTSGTSTILTATNVRFYSPQSTNVNSTSTAKILSSANVYSDTITLSSSLDLSPSTVGRQIQIVVDVRVPVGTIGGAYASSYGISSDIDPAQATGVVQYTIDSNYENISINGNQTNQIIGQVLVTAQNEDVKLNTLTLDPKFSDPNINPTFTGLTNLKLFFNGTQIGSTTSWNLDPEDRPIIFNFDSDVILPVGQQKTITVKSDLNFLSSLIVSTGTLNTVIGGLTSNAQGVTTNRLISVFAVPFNLATTTLTNYFPAGVVTFALTPGQSSSIKAPNSSQVKIGSFIIQPDSVEGITVTQLNVPISGTMLGVNQITNLTVKDGSNVVGTPIGNIANGNNYFSSNIVIPANTSKTFDIYADFGSDSNGLTVVPNMEITYRGNISNVNSTTPLVAGFATASAVSIISANEVSYNLALSPITQFIVGNQSNFSVGAFHFKVNNGIGGAIIKDLTFSFPSNTVSSIIASGKSATVVDNSATVYNIGATLPGDNSGFNVPISLSIPCVGISNGCTSNSPLTVKATLIGVTYYDGVSTKSIVGVNNPTNEFYVVGSKPTLSVSSTQQTGLAIGAENKIGEVTVASDASGQIKVNKITFNINSSGINSATINSSRIADGNTTITGSSCVRAGSLPEFVECSFTSGYVIPAGTSKTFSLYTTVTGTAGASVVNSISSSVSASGFEWIDTLGGNASFSGVQIYNFPTNSYSIRQ